MDHSRLVDQSHYTVFSPPAPSGLPSLASFSPQPFWLACNLPRQIMMTIANPSLDCKSSGNFDLHLPTVSRAGDHHRSLPLPHRLHHFPRQLKLQRPCSFTTTNQLELYLESPNSTGCDSAAPDEDARLFLASDMVVKSSIQPLGTFGLYQPSLCAKGSGLIHGLKWVLYLSRYSAICTSIEIALPALPTGPGQFISTMR